MKLEAMVRQIDEIATRIFDAAGEVVPMYHMIDDEGTEAVMPPPYEGGFSKDRSAQLMRIIFRVQNIQRYVFITEAWTAHLAADAAIPDSVKDHPDRVEVLMYIAEDEDEGELLASRKIIREDGQKPRLGPLQISHWKESEGRMVGMLPRKGRLQ